MIIDWFDHRLKYPTNFHSVDDNLRHGLCVLMLTKYHFFLSTFNFLQKLTSIIITWVGLDYANPLLIFNLHR